MSKEKNVAEGFSIEGMDKNTAITALIKAGLDFKAANKYWVENRPENGSGFKAGFYAKLVDGPMSEADFNSIIAEASPNVQKHRSAHNAVREAANEIWAKK